MTNAMLSLSTSPKSRQSPKKKRRFDLISGESERLRFHELCLPDFTASYCIFGKPFRLLCVRFFFCAPKMTNVVSMRSELLFFSAEFVLSSVTMSIPFCLGNGIHMRWWQPLATIVAMEFLNFLRFTYMRRLGRAELRDSVTRVVS